MKSNHSSQKLAILQKWQADLQTSWNNFSDKKVEPLSHNANLLNYKKKSSFQQTQIKFPSKMIIKRKIKLTQLNPTKTLFSSLHKFKEKWIAFDPKLLSDLALIILTSRPSKSKRNMKEKVLLNRYALVKIFKNLLLNNWDQVTMRLIVHLKT